MASNLEFPVLEFPGIPPTWDHFLEWLAAVDPSRSFRPMRTNECPLAYYLLEKVLSGAERVEAPQETSIRVIDPAPKLQKKAEVCYFVRVQGYAVVLHPVASGKVMSFLFEGTWLQKVNHFIDQKLQIPASKTETKCSAREIHQLLLQEHLSRCLGAAN